MSSPTPKPTLHRNLNTNPPISIVHEHGSIILGASWTSSPTTMATPTSNGDYNAQRSLCQQPGRHWLLDYSSYKTTSNIL